MQDTNLTRVGAGGWIMWGGLNTDATAAGLCPCPGAGGRVGIMLFGVNLGSSIATTSLANVWTIHNPENDVYYPAVAILDNGLTLASYGEWPSLEAVGCVLDVLGHAGTEAHQDREPGSRGPGRVHAVQLRRQCQLHRLWRMASAVR